MARLPLLLVLSLAATLWAGCRTAAPISPPAVPPDATTLMLTDDEMPRVLYASAWGAFAEAGWDIVDHDPEAMRLVARPEGTTAEAEVTIETTSPRAMARKGRIVVAVDPAQPGARDVLLGATRALATVPGHISFR